jgi:hypothetical protein
MLSVLNFVAAAQNSGPATQSSDPPSATYIVLAIAAVLVGFIILMFIRTSAGRSSKR